MRPRTTAVLTSLAAVLVAAGVAVAAPADHNVTFSHTVSPPNSRSFDIGWVDNSTTPGTGGQYFLADRTNNAVDLLDAASDTFRGYIGKGVFTGVSPLGRCGNGPDGVVTDDSGLVWVGDGNSSIKVLHPTPNTGAAALIKSIPTGGKLRADELAYDPVHERIVIANDCENFLAFIDVATQTVAGHFYYADNTVGQPASADGHKTANGGLEQSVFVPQTGLFYQAVPGDTASGTTGFIDVFDPVSMALVDTFLVPGCDNGPTGLALGPNQRFLGACDNGAAAVEVRHGQLHTIVPDVGGADEIWFNPGDNNFYLGIGGPPAALGVVNADNDHVVQVLPGKGGHSVAAYAANNHIFDPDRNGTGIDVFVSAGH